MESTRSARSTGARRLFSAFVLLSSVCGACSANPFGPEGDADGGLDASAGGGGKEGGAKDGGKTASHDGGDPSAPEDAGPSGDTGGGADPVAVHTGAFVHPGILVSGPQLAFLKAQIAAGAEPWTSALAAAKKSTFATTTATAKPPPHICCGTVSKPDIGCNQEKIDAETAYTDALIWFLSPTGGDAYGRAAIGILNNYATVGPDHFESTATCTDSKGNTGASFNTRLQSGWAGSVFPRAAEIMRSYTGAPALDVSGFQTMLRKSYVKNLIAGAADSPGNWELSIAEGLIQIGVFLDDNDTFNQGLAVWRRRVPAFLYVAADGAMGLVPRASSGPLGALGTAAKVCITPDWCPDTADIWLGPKMYMDGISQETCRDLSHVQYGMAALIDTAETASIQGIDLYAEQEARIVPGLELSASYVNEANAYGGTASPDPGCTITDPFQGGPLDMSAVGYLERGNPPAPTWEIALNHYGASKLPATARLVGKIRPVAADHHMNWETLTHGDVRKNGGPTSAP